MRPSLSLLVPAFALLSLATAAGGQSSTSSSTFGGVAGQASARSRIAFQKLFETGDPMPGYADTFNALSVRASLHAGEVAFSGFGGTTQTTALFRAPATGGGVASTIVDSTMIMPNSSVPFRGMSVPLIHDGLSVFSAKYFTANPWGIYSGDGSGAIDVVIDRTQGYSGFSLRGFDGDTVAQFTGITFSALWAQDLGSGVLAYVGTSGDPLPGRPGNVILNIQDVYLGNGSLVFSARCQNSTTFQTFYSIVHYDVGSGALATLVDDTTQVPGIGGTFTLVNDPTTDGATVLFSGSQGNPSFGGSSGLYRWDGIALEVIVDSSTAVPGGGTFHSFNGTYVGWRSDGDDVVFSATDFAGDVSGIYARSGGTLFAVVEVGDALDGRVVAGLDFSHEAYDAGQLVFRATFTDGQKALYVATLL